MHNNPLAYFLTFTTHGTWLHGDPRGSILRCQGQSRCISSHESLHQYHEERLKMTMVMDSCQRKRVLEAILKHCRVRDWRIFAVHVRTNHTHIIVRANKPIARVAIELKSWSTRILKQYDAGIKTVWARGSSKKYIFRKAKLKEKIHYVAFEQGQPMAYFIDDDFQGVESLTK